GLIVVRGWEGMAYGLLASGFLISSIAGTLFLPVLVCRNNVQQFKKKDKVSLVILAVIFFSVVVPALYSGAEYWIIDQGETTIVKNDSVDYKVYPTFEGKKRLELRLGEKYLGKTIEVDGVSKWGATKVTVDIVEGEDEEKVPYITIGLDDVREPLTVQTTDGVVFESPRDKGNE